MKTSTILKLAKKYVRSLDEDVNYICYAISAVSDDLSDKYEYDDKKCDAMFEKVADLHELIAERLHPYANYDDWIRHKHSDWLKKHHSYMIMEFSHVDSVWIAHDDCMPGRLRWMDALIAEFKAKGD